MRHWMFACAMLLAAACGSSTVDPSLVDMADQCKDKIKNGSETDVDCGGTCAKKCGTAQLCLVAADCAGNLCYNMACYPKECINGVRDGAETDVDCGGSMCPPCDANKKCNSAADCVSNNCSSFVCM